MTRTLILIPHARLDGAISITRGYPKPNTERDMRGWADDLNRLYRTPQADLEAWRATPRVELTRDQRGIVDAHEHLFTTTGRPIKGDLRDDGRVELTDGRHRANYIAERGDVVPVWVSSRDAARMERFERDCVDEVARERARERGRHVGRTALDGAPRAPRPDRQLGPEHLERTVDRDVFRGERRR